MVELPSRRHDPPAGRTAISSRPTIIVDQYQRAADRDAAGEANSYAGLRIHTLPGLHDHVGELIRKFAPPGGTAVDLGAGSGAMSARLRDMGYAPTAVDYVSENFQLRDTVAFARADLNGPFADAVGAPADLVVAVEIVEHLENPRHFLREAAKLCKPGTGRIVLTTPNTDNPVSKAMFCRFGNHLWFNDHDYVEQGHITPMSRWQIRKIAEETGLDLVHEGSYGDPFAHLDQWRNIRYLARAIRLISKLPRALSGEVYVAVLAPRV